MFGGMVLPFFMSGIASFLMLRMLSGRTRIVLASVLSGVGVILLIPPIASIYLYQSSHGIVALDDPRVRLGLTTAIAAAAFLTAGFWLFARAYRGIEVES